MISYKTVKQRSKIVEKTTARHDWCWKKWTTFCPVLHPVFGPLRGKSGSKPSNEKFDRDVMNVFVTNKHCEILTLRRCFGCFYENCWNSFYAHSSHRFLGKQTSYGSNRPPSQIKVLDLSNTSVFHEETFVKFSTDFKL